MSAWRRRGLAWLAVILLCGCAPAGASSSYRVTIPELGAPAREIPCSFEVDNVVRIEDCIVILKRDWRAILLELCTAAPPEERGEACRPIAP
jgi:hypothetical protein